jgi:hypothetical protein
MKRLNIINFFIQFWYSPAVDLVLMVVNMTRRDMKGDNMCYDEALVLKNYNCTIFFDITEEHKASNWSR